MSRYGTCIEEGCGNKAKGTGRKCAAHLYGTCSEDGCVANAVGAHRRCALHHHGTCVKDGCVANATGVHGFCGQHRRNTCKYASECMNEAVRGHWLCEVHRHEVCHEEGCAQVAVDSYGFCEDHCYGICRLESGCTKRANSNGFCVAHRYRCEAEENFDGEAEENFDDEKLCIEEGCTKPSRIYCGGKCYNHHVLESFNGDTAKWKRNADGYVVSKQILQHRWVWEQANGRSLRGGENVHHINGQRDDNHITNLELWSTSQPAGQRVKDKIDHAVEILCLYRPELLQAYACLEWSMSHE